MFSHAIKHINDSVTGGKPYDAEVEYIESTTDGQYIDTGITFDRLYDFEVEANCCPVVATRSIVCGTYSGSGTSFNLEFGGSDNGIERQPRGYIEIGSGALDKRAAAVSLNVLSTISLSYTASSRLLTLKSGNETITGTVASGSGTSSNTLWLFNDHRTGGMNRQVRISGIKVKKDGTVVRDLVPIRVGTEYCLYDKANPTGGDNGDGLYHNKGTGAFLGGIDTLSARTKFIVSRVMGSATGTIKPVLKHYDIATSYTIHECNGNTPTIVDVNFPSGKYDALDYTPTWEHHRFAGWTTKPPYDAEIEYLEGTGTQWIDTGFMDGVGSFSCKLGAKTIRNQSGGDWQAALGKLGSSNDDNHRVLLYNHKTWTDWRLASTSSSYSVLSSFPGTVEIPKTSFNTTASTLYSFRVGNGYSVSGPLPVLIYWFKIWNASNELVRDYIPVRVGQIGYLYDKATDQLLGNAGTGDFAKGGDTKVVSGNSISPSDDIIYDIKDIYATWQLPTTVTFDATTNGGQMPSGWTAPDYYEGQPYGTLPKPTKSGEVFLGWFTSGGTRVTESSIVTSGTLTARYAAVTYATKWEVNCTSTSYLKTGIYSARIRNSENPTVVDWGDGTYDVIYGNISQLVHTYASTGTRTVQVSDNISTIALSTSDTTFCQTTTSNYYNVRRILAVSPNVTSIPTYAFYYLYNLYSVVFGGNGETISLGSYAFYYAMRSGTAGTIDLSGRKCTSIPAHFCYYCYYLKNFYWPIGVTSIGSSAFRFCFYYSASTGTVEIPEGVTSISGTYAFSNCLYLTAVTLPSTLTNLNNYTFYNCTRLATITSNRSTAPTVSSATFGNGTTYYTGRTSYSTGTNKLRVPAGATGYNASYWSSVLLNSTKCGFTLEEMA